MTLRSDDGKILEVKEGIVLDRDGKPLTYPSESTNRKDRASFINSIKVFKLGGWLAPLGFIVLPLILLFGFLLMVMAAVFSIALWVVRAFLGKPGTSTNS